MAQSYLDLALPELVLSAKVKTPSFTFWVLPQMGRGMACLAMVAGDAAVLG